MERRRTAAGVIQVAHDLVRDARGLAKEYVSTIERRAAYITGMLSLKFLLLFPLLFFGAHNI